MRYTTAGWRKSAQQPTKACLTQCTSTLALAPPYLCPAVSTSTGDIERLFRKPTLPELPSALHASWACVPEEGKGWACNSCCIEAQSQQQPHSPQGRSPKWGSSLCSRRAWGSFPDTFYFRASLEKAIVMTQSCHMDPIFQLSDYFHPINNKFGCCCHHLHHQPHNPPQVHQVKPWRGILFSCSNNQSEEKVDIITVTHCTNICSTAKCNSCYINALAVLQLCNSKANEEWP